MEIYIIIPIDKLCSLCIYIPEIESILTTSLQEENLWPVGQLWTMKGSLLRLMGSLIKIVSFIHKIVYFTSSAPSIHWSGEVDQPANSSRLYVQTDKYAQICLNPQCMSD